MRKYDHPNITTEEIAEGTKWPGYHESQAAELTIRGLAALVERLEVMVELIDERLFTR